MRILSIVSLVLIVRPVVGCLQTVPGGGVSITRAQVTPIPPAPKAAATSTTTTSIATATVSTTSSSLATSTTAAQATTTVNVSPTTPTTTTTTTTTATATPTITTTTTIAPPLQLQPLPLQEPPLRPRPQPQPPTATPTTTTTTTASLCDTCTADQLNLRALQGDTITASPVTAVDGCNAMTIQCSGPPIVFNGLEVFDLLVLTCRADGMWIETITTPPQVVTDVVC